MEQQNKSNRPPLDVNRNVALFITLFVVGGLVTGLSLVLGEILIFIGIALALQHFKADLWVWWVVGGACVGSMAAALSGG